MDELILPKNSHHFKDDKKSRSQKNTKNMCNNPWFSEEEYDTYLSNVQTAVLEAYKYVGLQSVSNLTPQHLPFFIKGILEDLSFSTLSSKSYSIIHEDNLKPIVDRTFEDMYHAIMKQSNGGDYFLITFTDGLHCLAALPLNHGDPEYDENGSMINPSLRFVKINRNITDDWHKDNWSSIEDDVLSDSNIYITPDNMPVKIQYVNKISGERIIIDW